MNTRKRAKEMKITHIYLSKLSRIILVILCVFFSTACGYSREEKKLMMEYQKQGEINASSYIIEKYGINAAIVDSKCETVEVGPIPDLSPSATGNVLVTMEYNDRNFGVYISGEEETIKGADNYQLEEIKTSLEVMIEDLANLSITDSYLCYGCLHTIKDNKNGMVETYFDGHNLSEVLKNESAAVVVSVINQDVADVDMNYLKLKTGVEDYLLVDYTSENAYKSISEPYYNVAGTPIDSGINECLVYINGYYLSNYAEEIYKAFRKIVIDDIVLIADSPETEILIEKTNIDDASEWNGRGFINAKQVLDAYVLKNDFSYVDIYVPVEKLDVFEGDQIGLAIQYDDNHKNVMGGITDDGEYIYGRIYKRGIESEIKFSVFSDEE